MLYIVIANMDGSIRQCLRTTSNNILLPEDAICLQIDDYQVWQNVKNNPHGYKIENNSIIQID